MLAVDSSVFVCNSRFPVFCPVRKLSTAVLWQAGRRLPCLFNAPSKAQVHDVKSTIPHYKERANCQHVTFWPRCQCAVHCHTAKPEPHRRALFGPLPFQSLCNSPNVYVVRSMFISFWLRCCPNVVIYPLNIFLFRACWCISVSVSPIAIVCLNVFVAVCMFWLFMTCFYNSLNFCCILYVVLFFILTY